MQKLKRRKRLQVSNSLLNTFLLKQYSDFNLTKNNNNYKKFVNRLKKTFVTSIPNFRKRKIPAYIIYINLSRRNSRISLCDSEGIHLYSYTMGSLGNKKSKRSNVYFVKELCLKFYNGLQKYNISSFSLYIKGFGKTRRGILSFFSRSKLRYKCLYIIDLTSKSHNGCRTRAKRRI